MSQLMPLPLTVSCFSKIQIGFTFLVPAHLVVPEKGPLNGCNGCKRQIYQIAELNRIEKIDSVARIESNRNFFLPELECSIGYQFGARCQIICGPDSLGSLLDLELVLGEPELELSYAVAKVVNAGHRDGRLLTSRRRDRLHLHAQPLNYS